MRDERNISPRDTDPTLTISALVMPSPLSVPDLVQTRIACEDGSPLPETEYSESGGFESPDDLLAEAYPTFLPQAEQAVSPAASHFIAELTARLELALSESSVWGVEEGSVLQVRFGARRVTEARTPVVWVEFYVPEREAYVLPPMSLLKDESESSPFDAVGGDSLEFFVQGPARIIIEPHPSARGFQSVAWLSSLASDEAESHFVRGVRSPVSSHDSVLAAELVHQVRQYALHEGIIAGGAYFSDSEQFLESFGAGEVLSVSTQTDRSRAYRIRYTLLDADGCPHRILCSVILREHPVWGLRIEKAHITTASDSL